MKTKTSLAGTIRLKLMAWHLGTACATGLLTLVLLLTLPAAVQAQYYTYETNDDSTIAITKYNGPGGVVTIPDMIDGMVVKSIGSYAFDSIPSLINITIPNTVIDIGDGAFAYCTSLTNVTIGNGVTGIGQDAFGDCASLTNLTIPNSVTGIGDYAFSGCASLSSVAIPNGVTSIGEGVFYLCTSLTNITIPNGVTNIGRYAFSLSTNLSNVTIPDSATSIGSAAFADCTSLANITIPNGVTNIGTYAFFSCTSLSAITVDALNSTYRSADGVLFDKSQSTLVQCPGGKAGSYTVPNSVTNIGTYAFASCTSLNGITVDASNSF
jgi:hypothetical protein